MPMTGIQKKLFALQDIEYRDFQSRLIPGTNASFIGVRTPELRKLAKELYGKAETEGFLKTLPHEYFDENQLHAFIISEEKDFEKCVALTEAFLPFVDNWATCDQLSPKIFRKHKTELLTHVNEWLKSDRTYTVRFGIGMLMQHFLDGDFDLKYPQAVASLRSDEHYINMMIAWYFATALAKQYDAVVPFIQNRRLDAWTHNKAIQKSVESRRIDDAKKEYLRSLRLR